MLLLFMMFGQRLFGWLNTPVPTWFTIMETNKIYVIGGIFAFKYMINSAASTGAFEVSYDGVPVFSKLRSGKQPADGLQVKKMTLYSPCV